MRINVRHGGAVGMLAAAFGLLGPVAAQAGQAGQIPGASVSSCAGTCDLKATAAHLPGIAGTSIVLDRMLQRSDRCGWWDGEWRCGDFDFHHYHHYHYHYRYYRHGGYDRYYRHGGYDRYYRHGGYDRYYR